jgi:NADPH:quinone reductase
LPLPFSRPDPSNPVPLVINGASGAVGSFALKLASQNPTVTPIIAIAGANGASMKELGAHVVLDYRSPSIAEDLSAALGGKKIAHVLDCVNSLSSVKYLLPILDSVHGRYNCTAGITVEQKALLQQWGGWFEQIWVGSVHEDKPAGGKLFGSVMSKVFETLIAQGQLSGRPYEVVQGGLLGVKDALIKLRDRKGGNAKFVTRIADTK